MNKSMFLMSFMCREFIFFIIWIGMWFSLEYFAHITFNWTIAAILIVSTSSIRILDSFFSDLL